MGIEPSTVRLPVVGRSIAEVVRQRWASERPFVGTATEVLRRKLETDVLKPYAWEIVRRELARRGELGGP